MGDKNMSCPAIGTVKSKNKADYGLGFLPILQLPSLINTHTRKQQSK